ncbi:sensor histidine kinase [Parasphingorhabdus sp.]|uniref:sensor histidine kinase n=1 Tax=Parasphingorhabdus sp. TaxID=2709688 RepID=UPI002F95A9F9
MQQNEAFLALEKSRLETLESYQIMDSPPEAAFDRMTRLAADVFEVPMASISFVDDKRQWSKSAIGLESLEAARDISFSSHIVESREALIVEDLLSDERFAENPFVTGHPYVKFYAGCPLLAPNGMVLGALWIGDHAVRRQPFGDRLEQLRCMADIVMSELELRREMQQRKAAQRYAAEARTELEMALALSGTASWKLNLSTQEVRWGGDYHRVWGKDADQTLLMAEDVFARIHPEDRQRIRNSIEHNNRTENRGFLETFRIVMPSGETRWILGRGDFLHSNGADVVTGINYDITDAVNQADQQKLHTRELHHRLRNLFATLQSIMMLTRNSATSIDDYIERINGRLGALNRTQQILLDSDFITGSFAALVSDLCSIYPRMIWAGPDIRLPENAMVSISLVLNELATNAAKYGALSHEHGFVKITWTINDDDQPPSVSLTWKERGGPAIQGPPTQWGFGTSLIRHSITRNLRGKITKDWQEEGMICSINFPIP